MSVVSSYLLIFILNSELNTPIKGQWLLDIKQEQKAESLYFIGQNRLCQKLPWKTKKI